VRRTLSGQIPHPVARARATIPHPARRLRAMVRSVPSPAQAAERAVGELDDRIGIAKGGRKVLDHIFPDHWSFMLGELAMYSFIVLVATGIFLTLYYVPSGSKLIYHGVYRPLDGQQMTDSYASTLNISFGVRAGLLVRQMHHWAADVFIGSIIVHMLRIFFTSAYRRPRDTNWVIGTTMLLLAIFNGYLGDSSGFRGFN
jgi:ubiquinol-cytochrome c reductase cytochrome b subunit